MVDEETRIAFQISIILHCEKFWQGELSAEALGEIGDSAIPSLLPLLKQESNILFFTVMAFVQIGSPAALAVLTEAVNDDNNSNREAVIWLLGERGNSQIIPILTPLLEDQKESIRQAAAISLGLLGDSLIMPVLDEIMQGQNDGLRSATVRALGRIGNNAAIILLCKAATDSEEDVRKNVASALGCLGDENILPRKIVADTQVSVQQRVEALELLRSARYDFNAFGSTNPYRFPSTRHLCQIVLTEDNVAARRGAQEVLDYLVGNTLLRASQANSETEKDELLWGAQGSNTDPQIDTLLRPFDAILNPPYRRPASFWERIFGRK